MEVGGRAVQRAHTQHWGAAGVQRRLFPGVSPLAHLSNLKPTDPTAPRTRGLWTPARRRRCRAAGRARAPRTRPSWSCCPRPRWTCGRRGAALAAPHTCRRRTTQKFPPACHLWGHLWEPRVTSKPHKGAVLRPGFAPQVTKEASGPRPGAAVVVDRAGVIFRYSRSVFP